MSSTLGSPLGSPLGQKIARDRLTSRTSLMCAVGRVESGDFGGAIRFEPSLYMTPPNWVTRDLDKIMQTNSCDYTTAVMIASTSWGRYQLLGTNIYSLTNYRLVDFLDCGQFQSECFYQFVERGGFGDLLDIADIKTVPLLRLQQFAAFYNGPGAPEVYMHKLLDAVA